MSSAAITISICCMMMSVLLLLAMVGIALGEISGLLKRVEALEKRSKYTPRLPDVGDVHPFTPDATVSRTDVDVWGTPCVQ